MLSFFFIFIIVIIIIWLLYHHHHHHHHHHHYHYYYYFIIILAITILVWRIFILPHNQSSKFFVILKHFTFLSWATFPLKPFHFPDFSLFLILTIRVVPWGTTITIIWHHPCFLSKNILLRRRCSMPWSSSSSSSSSSSWFQLLFSFLLSLNTDILFCLGDELGVRQTVCPDRFLDLYM